MTNDLDDDDFNVSTNAFGRIPNLLWRHASDQNVYRSRAASDNDELYLAATDALCIRFLSIFAGYMLARMNLFSKAASKGASEVTMNVSLPALIFANIVPAFTPQNISALGPLFLLAWVYQGIGFILGLIIREVCYVPRNFWQGIVIMTALSNWANLREHLSISNIQAASDCVSCVLAPAVVLSVTQQAPFDPATDPQRTS